MEITEYVLYQKLAQAAKEPSNRDVLNHISQDELGYYELWKGRTGRDVPPNIVELHVYYWIARVFGIVFMMKLRDFFIRRAYASLSDTVPEAERIARNGISHITMLRNAMDEERLHYMGAFAMGLNDAIVEVTGAIAGFTFALQSTTLVALTGLITGTAGALSMGASEYLEKQAEEAGLSPAKAAGYTGGLYLITAVILVSPYFLLGSYLVALVVMLFLAFIIIVFFSLYSTFLSGQKFQTRFPQMLVTSFGVAFVSFLIGTVLRVTMHVNV